MKTLRLPEQDVPVACDADVCVVGGSCTGAFAAVAAARLGARVALVELNGMFGGVATAGLVNIWHSLHDTEGKRQIIAGMTGEVIERLKRRDAVGPAHGLCYVLNTAELALELDAMLVEAGVRPFLHAMFSAPVMKDGKLDAVVIEDKSGRRAIKAKCFIDATGDGDVAVRAGLPFWIGENKDLQPPTACLLLRGLDEIKNRNPGFNLGSAVHDKKYPQALKEGFLWSARVIGAPGLEMVAGSRVHGANCCDADSLTSAEIESRRQIRAMLDILRQHVPGGAAAAPVALPSYIGIRETRHLKGLYSLTGEEALNGAQFPDAIANASYQVDIHHSDKPGITFRYLDGKESYHEPGKPTQEGRWRKEQGVNPTFYQIPYRCLVPEGSKNLLAAGRMISVDRVAYGSVRVMVNCNQTGEAAAAAAFLALDSGADVASIDCAKLRAILTKQGAAVI